MKQTIEIPMQLPAPANRRGAWYGSWHLGRSQQQAVTAVLRAQCSRPALPCVVSFVRVANRGVDTDNLPNCFKATRDAIALWIHGRPLRELRPDGKIRMPRAPDGRNDGIDWQYAQVHGPKGYQALRVTIEET